MHRQPRRTAPAPADSESQTNGDCVKRGRTSRRQDRNQSSAGESRSQGISWELVLCGSACSLHGSILGCHCKTFTGGQDHAIPDPSLGQRPKRGGRQSAADAPGQETSNSPLLQPSLGLETFNCRKIVGNQPIILKKSWAGVAAA